MSDDVGLAEEDAYFAALGRLAAASSSLELLIYWIGGAFEIPKIDKLPGSEAAKKIAAQAGQAAFTVPEELDLADWAKACVEVLDRRGALVHAAFMFELTVTPEAATLSSGIKRTRGHAEEPLRPRRVDQVKNALADCWKMVERTGQIFSAVAAAKRAQQTTGR